MFTSGDDDRTAPDREGLRQCPIFSALTDAELETIRGLLDRRHFEAGSIIFRKGDPGDSCYILEDGIAEILHGSPDNGSTRVIAELSANAVLGEGCLLTDHPRSATARARSDVQALRLARSDFDTLLEADDLGAYRMVMSMAAELHRRLVTTNNLLDGLLGPDGTREDLEILRRRLGPEWSLY